MKQNYICLFAIAILKLFLYRVTTKASTSLFYHFKFGLYIYWNGYSLNIHIILSVSSYNMFSSTILFYPLFHVQGSNFLNLQHQWMWFETNSGSNFYLSLLYLNPKAWLKEKCTIIAKISVPISQNLQFIEFSRF